MSEISHILIVDDEPALVKLFAEVFQDDDRRVYSAQCGEEALTIINERPIDLVVSDVRMPKMNGFELASIIRKQHPEIKIQLVSGHAGHEERPADVQDLANRILMKPVDLRDLVQRVNELLNA